MLAETSEREWFTRRPDPKLTDEQAEAQGGFVERLVGNPGGQVALIAPHGGRIEPGTHEQALCVHELLQRGLSVCWFCMGFPKRRAYGAWRWHVPSTQIRTTEFPRIGQLLGRRFSFAVSFHGAEPRGSIYVGGGAPRRVRRDLAGALQRALGATRIELPHPEHPLSGSDPANLVNRLSEFGIQLEQSRDVRRRPRLVAQVVADFLRERL